MASLNITRKTLVVLLGGAMVATSAQAQAQSAAAPQDDSTSVSDITVVGGKVAPNTENPRSSTCEFLVATDPFVRAQIEAADGDPLMGPTFYQPTRFPRNVEFGVEPLSVPGSALPTIPRQFRGVSTRTAATTANPSPSEVRLDPSSPPPTQVFQNPEFADDGSQSSVETAINSCRTLYSSGSGAYGPGRFDIAYRDKFMPTAFALFDDRRYAESLDYFQRAFKKLPYDMGGDEAALMIGKLYLGAPGVKRNTREALVWLERAGGARFNPTSDMPIFDPLEPERNTAIGEASMILARIYQTGFDGTPKNPAMARKMFERAFRVGHVAAASILGDIYYYGAGTPRDLAKAFDWYKRGATLGHAPSQYALGQMYLRNEAPGGTNVRLGLAWHNEAAKIGYAGSLYVLAVAYEKGEGVPADAQRALGLYKLAALGGSAPASNTIGAYFYEGRMVSKDAVTARKWFEQAAVDGDPDGMYNLGAMMMKGEGGATDRTRAWVWLKLAEKSDNADAPAAVRVLEARMTDEEKAEAQRLLSPSNS
jgi:TPR repeat protein